MTASGSKPESYGSHDAPVSESQSDSSHRENALIPARVVVDSDVIWSGSWAADSVSV